MVTKFEKRFDNISSLRFYKVPKSDIEKISNIFAQGFYEDPLFKEIFPQDNIRKKVLPKFFNIYIDFIYNYSNVYATSSDIEGIMLFYHPERVHSKIAYFLKAVKSVLKSIKICSIVSLKQFLKAVSVLKVMNDDWVDNVVDSKFVHLDLLVVQKKYRGHKLMSKLIRPVLKEITNKELICTLETNNKKNVNLYKHFGFEVKEVITLPDSNLAQYCMVYNA